MKNNDIQLNVLLPTKGEIRDLIKRGIISSVPTGTDYADVNNYLKKYFIKEIQSSKLEYEINKQEKGNEKDVMRQIISRKKEKLVLSNLLEKSVTIG